jgi:hypothetical protein
MPKQLSAVVLLVALALCAGSCDDAPGGVYERRVRGDTVFIRSIRPAFEDTVWMQPLQQYGVVEGPVELMFSRVEQIAIGPGGSVFVYDYQQGIKQFSSSGKFVRWVARAGQGPEEVGYIVGLTVNEAGEVAAYDQGNARIVIFGANGGARTFHAPTGVRPISREDVLQYAEDGALWVAVNPEVRDLGRYPRPLYARLTTSGEVDSLIALPLSISAPPCDTPTDRARFGGGIFDDKRDLFIPKPRWTLGPDGRLVVGCPATYAFEVHGLGDHRLAVEREWEAVALQPAARVYYSEQLGWPVPGRKPAYSRIIVDPIEKRFWVRPEVQPEAVARDPNVSRVTGQTHSWIPGSSGTFDVFDSEGVWLARVGIPRGLEYDGYSDQGGFRIRGDTVWARTRGEMNVEHVTKFLVKWPNP